MSARSRLVTPTTIPAPTGNRRLPTEGGSRGGTRSTAPLSSHTIGAVRHSTGGDGDGGSASWKRSAPPMTIARLSTTARSLEKNTIASTLRAATNRTKVLDTRRANPRQPRSTSFVGNQSIDRECLLLSPGSRERSQQQQRRPAVNSPILKRDILIDAQSESRIESQQLIETGIQSNEREILNHDLIVGDVKLLTPSPELTKQIDQARLESKRKVDRPTMRKFSTHEQDEEHRLDELKQFMESNYVTRRPNPKKASPLAAAALAKYESNQCGTIFKSMDEFFTRDIPKTESITNIKERIKRKEIELMSLFDNVALAEKIESGSEGD
ncbi:uncharacterized protein LOC6569065 [Drosophila grimshawi]|uniref:GH22949 n=1 Tax=Drosophila grimshawi TaxID=7222 RepID=B4JW06_DROGR|nr:uncharacterized protein LOC6569065 [Drosophila grimshawi]EDV98144.1 GH22949 [Drosophila grimshawi]